MWSMVYYNCGNTHTAQYCMSLLHLHYCGVVNA